MVNPQKNGDQRFPDITVDTVHEFDVTDPSRRRFLAAMGGTGLIITVGCLGNDDEGDYSTYVVTFADQDISVEIRDDRPIWDQANDEGVDIPYRCGVGRCGECTIKYEGDANEIIEHTGNQYLTGEQIVDGWVLTCVAYARADFDAVVTHPGD